MSAGLISCFGDARGTSECEIPHRIHAGRTRAAAAPPIVALVRPVFGDDGGITSATQVITLVQALALASVNTLTFEIDMIFWTSVALVIVAPRQRHQAVMVVTGRSGATGS